MSDGYSPPRTPARIFFSYSHEDDAFRAALAKHLTLLKRMGIIEGWHDRMIGAGEEWEKKIDEHLEAADIILLLVSADFLASDYCWEREMRRALERHEAGEARVIPIFLRSCDWRDAPFAKLQGLPRNARPISEWTDPDLAWSSVAEEIRGAVALLR